MTNFGAMSYDKIVILKTPSFQYTWLMQDDPVGFVLSTPWPSAKLWFIIIIIVITIVIVIVIIVIAIFMFIIMLEH